MGRTRRFSVWQWESRLAFRDDVRPDLWWVTQQELLHIEDACAFGERELGAARVCRAYAVEFGFQRRSKNNGATLRIEPTPFDVLVPPDDWCMARVQGEMEWHRFPPIKKQNDKRPHFIGPPILSPVFQLGASRKGLIALEEVIFASQIAQLPDAQRDLWESGEMARPVRLIKTAIALGWAEGLAQLVVPRFWEQALARATSQANFQLPLSLRDCAELKCPGSIAPACSHQGRMHAALFIYSHLSMLRISFLPQFNSSHEELEAYLELRNWLAQFFPSTDVERWINRK